MNARRDRQNPQDRQLERLIDSFCELGKDQLLAEFDRVFCEIVPPAGMAPVRRHGSRGKSATSMSGDFDLAPGNRRPSPAIPGAPGRPAGPTRSEDSA